MVDQADNLRKMVNSKNKVKCRAIAVTSGKGGVGKTNIIVNLGLLLNSVGKNVLLFDADLGLSNVDILLGLKTKYSLSDVAKGKKKLEDIVVNVKKGFNIIPAGSGFEDIANIDLPMFNKIKNEMNSLIKDVDVLLIDTGAGISKKVTLFLEGADEVIVVVTPEPTSIADAYAMIKILTLNYKKDNLKLFVNMTKNEQEANAVYENINKICEKFLKKTVDNIGYAVYDKNVPITVKRQKAIVQLNPNSNFSISMKKMTNNLFSENIEIHDNPIARFFSSLLGQKI